MSVLNVYIKKFCISNNKRVIDILRIFEKNRTNLVIVIDKNEKFVGIVTISDIRKAILSRVDIRSSIDNYYNEKPTFFYENQYSNKQIGQY